jgi:hypothetical protein
VSEELHAAAMAKLQEMGGTEGFGAQSMSRSLNMDPSDQLVDKYNLEEDTNALKEKLFANNDEDDVTAQNDFLKIAKGPGDMESLKEEKPLTADQVKFKEEAEEQAALNGAPKIQELASTTFTNSTSNGK